MATAEQGARLVCAILVKRFGLKAGDRVDKEKLRKEWEAVLQQYGSVENALERIHNPN